MVMIFGIGGKRDLFSVEAACCFDEHYRVGNEDFLIPCWGGHRWPDLQAQKNREQRWKTS